MGKIAVNITNEYESKTLQEILVGQGKTWPTAETRYVNLENVWKLPRCVLIDDTIFSVTDPDNSMVNDYQMYSLEEFLKIK